LTNLEDCLDSARFELDKIGELDGLYELEFDDIELDELDELDGLDKLEKLPKELLACFFFLFFLPCCFLFRYILQVCSSTISLFLGTFFLFSGTFSSTFFFL
jgi:hypothetical protein